MTKNYVMYGHIGQVCIEDRTLKYDTVLFQTFQYPTKEDVRKALLSDDVIESLCVSLWQHPDTDPDYIPDMIYREWGLLDWEKMHQSKDVIRFIEVLKIWITGSFHLTKLVLNPSFSGKLGCSVTYVSPEQVEQLRQEHLQK